MGSGLWFSRGVLGLRDGCKEVGRKKSKDRPVPPYLLSPLPGLAEVVYFTAILSVGAESVSAFFIAG